MAIKKHIIISLKDNHKATIDIIDSDLCDFKWRPHKGDNTIYVVRSRNILMHRVILERILNRPLSQKEKVDHIDGDGLNCKRDNLRLATSIQNGQNRRISKNNRVGFKGVSKSGNRFRAQINVNNARISLGCYATAELAGIAYDEAASKYFGEFAKTNRDIICNKS